MSKTAAVLAFFLLTIYSATAQRDSWAPPTDNYDRFNPSIVVILIILLAAFFFMAFFALYVRRCAGNDPASVQAGGGARGILRSRRAAAPRGLDPAVVATFPTLDYSVVKELKLGKSTLECAVCLCEFDDSEALRLLPPCSHVFHPDCIDEWLRSHTTCPVCRADLSTPSQAVTPPELPAGEADSVAIDIDTNPTQVLETAEGAEERLPPLPPLPRRSKSMRRARFSRSHSTGHSVVQPGENCDRYTLRLPDEIRKEVLKGKLNRTGSSLAGDREGSARGRSFSRWERFTRSDRWGLSLAPPFFSRSFSGRGSSRMIRRGKDETAGAGEGSVGRSGRVLLTTVKAPFDCLTGARSGVDPGESSTVPVFTVPVSGERV